MISSEAVILEIMVTVINIKMCNRSLTFDQI